jgi:hypothetical protein
MITPTQLQNQTPGSQPSFITGSYPGATWTSYDDFNNGYGVYEPYSQSLIASNVEGAGSWIAANQNVVNQFSALMLQAFPAMAAGETSNTAYCAANPTAFVCQKGSSFLAGASPPPPNPVINTVQSGNTGSGAAGATPSMTSNDNVGSTSTNIVSSSGLSGMDWLVIAGAGVLGLMFLMRK